MQAHRRPALEQARTLGARDAEGALEIGKRRLGVGAAALRGQLPAQPVQLGLVHPLAVSLHLRDRLVEYRARIVEATRCPPARGDRREPVRGVEVEAARARDRERLGELVGGALAERDAGRAIGERARADVGREAMLAADPHGLLRAAPRLERLAHHQAQPARADQRIAGAEGPLAGGAALGASERAVDGHRGGLAVAEQAQGEREHRLRGHADIVRREARSLGPRVGVDQLDRPFEVRARLHRSADLEGGIAEGRVARAEPVPRPDDLGHLQVLLGHLPRGPEIAPVEVIEEEAAERAQQQRAALHRPAQLARTGVDLADLGGGEAQRRLQADAERDLDLELDAVAIGAGRQRRGQEIERAPELLDGGRVRRPLPRARAAAHPPGDRGALLSGLGEVQRHQLRMRRGLLGKRHLEGARHARMRLVAQRRALALIDRVADQGVAEAVVHAGHPLRDDDLGLAEAIERLRDRRLIGLRHGLEHRERERVADGGGDLRGSLSPCRGARSGS